MFHPAKGWRLPALLALLAAASLAGSAAAADRQFAQKDCLDCHKKAAEKFGGLKFAHKAVKDRNCEACHLRHGLVPKLLLKAQGNALCLQCHKKEQLGLDKANVHAVLKTGTCQ
jgi:predicted CXXCH cytochrome family protein